MCGRIFKWGLEDYEKKMKDRRTSLNKRLGKKVIDRRDGKRVEQTLNTLSSEFIEFTGPEISKHARSVKTTCTSLSHSIRKKMNKSTIRPTNSLKTLISELLNSHKLYQKIPRKPQLHDLTPAITYKSQTCKIHPKTSIFELTSGFEEIKSKIQKLEDRPDEDIDDTLVRNFQEILQKSSQEGGSVDDIITDIKIISSFKR